MTLSRNHAIFIVKVNQANDHRISTMTASQDPQKNKALHELMEDEFQQLVDIIEQKQIVHEDIDLGQVIKKDPITQAAQQLHQQSQELGAETLAEFFHELESSSRNGILDESAELLNNIQEEFKNVRNILTDN
jgi:Cu2+-containing amine oxidase